MQMEHERGLERSAGLVFSSIEHESRPNADAALVSSFRSRQKLSTASLALGCVGEDALKELSYAVCPRPLTSRAS